MFQSNQDLLVIEEQEVLRGSGMRSTPPNQQRPLPPIPKFWREILVIPIPRALLTYAEKLLTLTLLVLSAHWAIRGDW